MTSLPNPFADRRLREIQTIGSLMQSCGRHPAGDGPLEMENRIRAIAALGYLKVHRIVKALKGPNDCFLTAYTWADGVEKKAVDVSLTKIPDWVAWVDEPFTNDEIEAIRAAAAAKLCPPPHDIIVVLDGGLVDDVDNLPPGVRVLVRDYDVEGADADRIHTGANGERYCQFVYDRMCVVCNGEHPPCTKCGGVTRCDVQEREAFTLCDSCDLELQDGRREELKRC